MSNYRADMPWPVQVCVAGRLRVVALMNRKAYQKSLETGIVWILHPSTGRVLPWPGEPVYHSLAESTGCFSVDLPEGSNLLPYGDIVPDSVNPDERKVDSAHREGDKTTNDRVRESILNSMFDLVRQRQDLRPAGSYTAHLFDSGLPKIRKKLGEEAIELILATSKADVVYEAGDLLYHLVVLLQASGISWSDLEQELESRREAR